MGNCKMLDNSAGEEIEAPQQTISSSRVTHASATACIIVNAIAFLTSVPVWIMARKAAVWSGGSENWDALYLFLFGAGVLIIQIIIALAFLVVLIRKFKKWTKRERWICAVTLLLPVLSTLLAFAYSSPFLA